MKKQLIGLGMTALMLGGVGSAGATLTDKGNGVIWTLWRINIGTKM